MPGGKSPGPSIKRPKVYEKLKEEGHSKESAARISNAGQTHAERSKMAKKAARTRRDEH